MRRAHLLLALGLFALAPRIARASKPVHPAPGTIGSDDGDGDGDGSGGGSSDGDGSGGGGGGSDDGD